MIGASITRTGCGDAIVRRQPRLPSCITVQPSSSARSPGDFFAHERADGLVGIPECRIVEIDHRLRDERHHLLVDAATLERIHHRVLEHEADRALRVGDRVADRHRRDLAGGDFGAAEDEADLRAVAVREHDVPARGDHVDDVRRRRADGVVLVLERSVLRVADERVAADGDHRNRR